MKDKVYRFICEHQMLSPGDSVAAAVSGGKDSMALLWLLVQNADDWNIQVSAAHVNHHLRGQESDRDEAFVRDFCREYNIPLQVFSVDVPAKAEKEGRGVEDAARRLRYEALLTLDEDKIATAHTADDNAETVLLHMARGTGLGGLCGIPPVNGRVIRPLLCVTQKELLTWSNLYGISHIEDSTNLSLDYTRNRIRKTVIPFFLQENPKFILVMSALTEELRSDAEMLHDQAQELFLEAKNENGGLSVPVLQAAPSALQKEVLRELFRPVPDISRTHIDAAVQLLSADSPSAEISLPGGWKLQRKYDTVILAVPGKQKELPDPVVVTTCGSFFLGDWRIQISEGICPTLIPTGIQFLRKEVAFQPLILRTGKAGDIIRRPGGAKKLNRFFIDKKIPKEERQFFPVAEINGKIAAVLPLETAVPYRAKPGEESIIFTAEKMPLSAGQENRRKTWEGIE